MDIDFLFSFINLKKLKELTLNLESFIYSYIIKIKI